MNVPKSKYIHIAESLNANQTSSKKLATSMQGKRTEKIKLVANLHT